MYIYNISKNNISFYNSFQKNLKFQKENFLIKNDKLVNTFYLKIQVKNLFYVFLNLLNFIKKKIFYIFLNLLKFKKNFNFFKLKNNKNIFKKYNISFFLGKKKR
jgi:hypothetical protein